MAGLTGLDVVRMGSEEFLKRFKGLEQICPECEIPITECVNDGLYIIGGKRVHGDCYFESLSAHLDAHPINNPMECN